MTSSQRILTGLAAGIGVGVFFGERAAVFSWAADGFVKLLQMTVLPYVTVSIVSSLGRLDYAQARALGVRVGGVVLLLWLIALSFAFLIPLTFPSAESASFFSAALIEKPASFDFVSLYIPSNPFYSLANNIVPAVVLFSAIVGVALIGVERKHALLDVLEVVRDAVSRATRYVAKLTPYGLFAIAATTAGTITVDQLGRLQIYLIAYVVVALLVSLWVLPGLIAALTPIRLVELLRTTQGALITAFVAGDLFIVLPSLIDASRTLVERHSANDARASALPDVIVPASFNFPHSGKLLSISFILFAGWFADAAIPSSEYPQLGLSGLVTFFGSLNAAVPYLLDLFRIPADTFQLFLATGVINSRFGTLLAAVHTLTVAVLGTCAMIGLISWNRRRIVRYAIVTVALAGLVVTGARTLFATVMAPEYDKDQVLQQMHMLTSTANAVVHRTLPALDLPPPSVATLDAIRMRGSIRVGYLPDALPYAFFNQQNQLVGLDMELAHRLATELGVRLDLVPLPREHFTAFLDDGRCDIVMSGVVVTTLRASKTLFSSPYMDETLGLLVPDHDRERYQSWAAIDALGSIMIGVPDVPHFIVMLRMLAPRAVIVPLASAEEAFAGATGLNAMALPAERGSAWTLLYPQYSVVVPEGALVKVPLAYPVARHDEAFATFLTTWIDLKRKDGTLDRLYKYWVLGQNAAPARPRWSVARNVLHWIE
jgi:Na+/H+-dicarboxylate symporter/ABC-type amino acid transport substrate-binding protein